VVENGGRGRGRGGEGKSVGGGVGGDECEGGQGDR